MRAQGRDYVTFPENHAPRRERTLHLEHPGPSTSQTLFFHRRVIVCRAELRACAPLRGNGHCYVCSRGMPSLCSARQRWPHRQNMRQECAGVEREGDPDLPGAHLAIRENAHVVSVHCTLYQVLGVLEHVGLAAAGVKHLHQGSERGRVVRPEHAQGVTLHISRISSIRRGWACRGQDKPRNTTSSTPRQ